MSVVPTYLRNRSGRIRAMPEQDAFSIGAYRSVQSPLMDVMRGQLPREFIARADVVAMFCGWDRPELALAATMVWGGARLRWLRGVLDMAPADLLHKLNGIRALIRRGQLSEAYMACSEGGQFRIRGVGPSFFTKIFFFMGQVARRLELKPLILDRWTSNAFFALSYQAFGRKFVERLFDVAAMRRSREKDAIIRCGTPRDAAFAYVIYCQFMNYWAGEIGVEPGKLEQFVFGEDRRACRHSVNVRQQMLAIIEQAIR